MKTGIYWQNPAYPAKGMDFIFDPSLVLYLPLYRLDGASFRSKDAYGHLCTVTGALWRPDGRYFDGSDDVIALGTSAGNLSTTGSICVWMKPASDFNQQGLVINHGGGWGRAGWMMSAYGDTQLFRFQWQEGTDRSLTSAGTFTLGAWVFYVCTHDGTTIKIYKDAVVDSNTLANSEDATTGLNGYIGYEATQGALPFKGNIGEVMIYNRALTPLEIQHHYLATKWRYQ